MHQYRSFTPDAGRYMVSETETRALLDYVLKHRNIAAILTFGESDNLVTAGGRSAASAGLNLVDFAERANAPARRVGIMPILAGAWDAAEGAAAAACSCRAPRAAAARNRRPPGAAAAACSRPRPRERGRHRVLPRSAPSTAS